ncbi:MAG TPA: ECF-type sigma factor [Bryobacteraceae bacterium]
MDGRSETLGEKIAAEFEALRAEGMSTAEIYGQLYADLRKLAHKKTGPISPGMSATSVVHKLWLRVLGKRPISWESGQHFVRSMAVAMQNLLIDEGRRSRPGTIIGDPTGPRPDELIVSIHISMALARLANENGRQAEIVRLINVAGLTEQETADSLDCSLSLVKKEYRKAKAWLKDFMDNPPSAGPI